MVGPGSSWWVLPLCEIGTQGLHENSRDVAQVTGEGHGVPSGRKDASHERAGCRIRVVALLLAGLAFLTACRNNGCEKLRNHCSKCSNSGARELCFDLANDLERTLGGLDASFGCRELKAGFGPDLGCPRAVIE